MMDTIQGQIALGATFGGIPAAVISGDWWLAVLAPAIIWLVVGIWYVVDTRRP